MLVLLLTSFLDDDEIQPDSEAVELEMLGIFKGLPFNEP
jgi:hypothetical protein